MDQLKAVVGASRTLRSEMQLSPAARMPMLTVGDADFIAAAAPLLKALARVSEVRVLGDDDAFAAATQATPVAVVGSVRLALQVLIDPATELARLGKEIARIEAEIGKAENKLGNAGFAQRAPAAVVDQERQRLDEFIRTRARLQDQANRLATLT